MEYGQSDQARFQRLIFSKKGKIMLAFFKTICYYTLAVKKRKQYPGVAKFGIALEWGSRGLEFESRHSDQTGADFLPRFCLFW